MSELSSSTSAALADLVLSIPVIAFPSQPLPSDSPIERMVSRAIELKVREVQSFRALSILQRLITPDVERQRALFTECDKRAQEITGHSDAMYDELSELSDRLEESPATTAADLLAKLRWIVSAHISEDGDPSWPTVEDAYSWHGDSSLATLIARLWADAERLLGASATTPVVTGKTAL
jgi:hypothetical protein